MFRYKGKGTPDAIMAEICWRAQNLYEDPDFDIRMKHMEDIEEDDQMDDLEYYSSESDNEDLNNNDNGPKTRKLSLFKNFLKENLSLRAIYDM